MADETTDIQEQQSEETITTQEAIAIFFEDILPWTLQGGDTGLSSRLKLKRNFEKIKMWINSASYQFLSRLHDDTAGGHITFMQGLSVITRILFGDYIYGKQGGVITDEGSAELNDLWVRAVAWIDRLESRNFSGDGIFDRGMAAWIDEQGDSHGILDYLTVRKKWYAWLLEIRELSYVGGDYIFSGAGSRILHVEWYDGEDRLVEKIAVNLDRVSYFRCWMYTNDGTTRTMNYWRRDDQARCHTDDTVSVGENQEATNKDYWRRVMAIGRCAIPTLAEGDQNYGVEMEYVDLSMADCDINSTDIPETGDKIVQIGNWTDPSRQSLMELQVAGEGSPAFKIYHKVGADGKHFVMPEPSTVLSPHGNIIRGTFISEAGEGMGGTIEERMQQLLQQINDVKNQADQKIDTWFGEGAPQPNEHTPTAEATYPSSMWNTVELKTLHAGDMYYDENHEPADPNGGRAWRWEATEDGGQVTFIWKDITDADTREALEKISDVASDGKLTAGAEKTRVLKDWRWEVSQLLKYGKQYWDEKDEYDRHVPVEGVDYSDFDTAWTSLSTAWTNYLNAFKALGRLLNDGAEISISYHTVNNVQREPTAVATPAWLNDLTTTTDIPNANAYRSAWNTYFEKLGLLAQAFAVRDGEQIKIPYGVTAELKNDGKEISLRVSGTEATLYGDGGTAQNPISSSLVVKFGAIEQEVINARGNSSSLTLRLSEITTTVTNNKTAADAAFKTLRDDLDAEIGNRKDLQDAYEATWVYQNDHLLSLMAAQFNGDGTIKGYADLKVQVNQISTTVTDNKAAADAAFKTLRDDLDAEIENREDLQETYEATWVYQNDHLLSLMAAQFNSDGTIKGYADLKVQVNNISSTVTDNKDAADAAISQLNTKYNSLDSDLDDVADSASASATWISQNRNKWRAVAASFDDNGNVTASGSVGLYVNDKFSTFEVDADKINFTGVSFGWSVTNNNGDQIFHLDSNGNLSIAGELTGGKITGSYVMGSDNTYQVELYADERITGLSSSLLHSGIRGYKGSQKFFDLSIAGTTQNAMYPLLMMTDAKTVPMVATLGPDMLLFDDNAHTTLLHIGLDSNGKVHIAGTSWYTFAEVNASSIGRGTVYADSDGFLKIKNWS